MINNYSNSSTEKHFGLYDNKIVKDFILSQTPYLLDTTSSYILYFDYDVSVNIEFRPNKCQTCYFIIMKSSSQEKNTTAISIHSCSEPILLNPKNQDIYYIHHSSNGAALKHHNKLFSTIHKRHFIHNEYFRKQKFKSITL